MRATSDDVTVEFIQWCEDNLGMTVDDLAEITFTAEHAWPAMVWHTEELRRRKRAERNTAARKFNELVHAHLMDRARREFPGCDYYAINRDGDIRVKVRDGDELITIIE